MAMTDYESICKVVKDNQRILERLTWEDIEEQAMFWEEDPAFLWPRTSLCPEDMDLVAKLRYIIIRLVTELELSKKPPMKDAETSPMTPRENGNGNHYTFGSPTSREEEGSEGENEPENNSQSSEIPSVNFDIPNLGAAGPTGDLAVVFTEIQGSAALAEAYPKDMSTALLLHNAVVRRLIKATHGYEVKSQGGTFMVVFADAVNSVKFCVLCQQQLLEVSWPASFTNFSHTAVEYSQSHAVYRDGCMLFSGLRVAMGVHYGPVLSTYDALTGVTDYFGPTVQAAAEIAKTSLGGEILISGAVQSIAKPYWQHWVDNPECPAVDRIPAMQLPSSSEPTHIFRLFPNSLGQRLLYFKLKTDRTQRVSSASSSDASIINVAALVACRVEGVDQLADSLPEETMDDALDVVQSKIDALSKQFQGYESKKTRATNLLAFTSCANAINFCLNLQIELLRSQWPPELLTNPSCKAVVGSNGLLINVGLKVSIGVDFGYPESQMDPWTNKMSYTGRCVLVASCLARAASGGAIFISSEVLKELERDEFHYDDKAVIASVGFVDCSDTQTKRHITVTATSNSPTSVEVSSMFPISLQDRQNQIKTPPKGGLVNRLRSRSRTNSIAVAASIRRASTFALPQNRPPPQAAAPTENSEPDLMKKLHVLVFRYFALMKQYLDPYQNTNLPKLAEEQFMSAFVVAAISLGLADQVGKSAKNKERFSQLGKLALEAEPNEDSSRLARSIVGHLSLHFKHCHKTISTMQNSTRFNSNSPKPTIQRQPSVNALSSSLGSEHLPVVRNKPLNNSTDSLVLGGLGRRRSNSAIATTFKQEETFTNDSENEEEELAPIIKPPRLLASTRRSPTYSGSTLT